MKIIAINSKDIGKNLVCENDNSGVNKSTYNTMLREPYALPTLVIGVARYCIKMTQALVLKINRNA